MCCRVTSLTLWATLPPSCHLNGDRLSEQERALRSPTAWPLGLRDKSSDLSWLQPLCGVRIFLTGILGVSGKEWLQSGGHFLPYWIQTPLIHTWGCLEGIFPWDYRSLSSILGFSCFQGLSSFHFFGRSACRGTVATLCQRAPSRVEGKHSCEQPGDTQVCAECLLGTIVPLYWGTEPWFDPERLRALLSGFPAYGRLRTS